MQLQRVLDFTHRLENLTTWADVELETLEFLESLGLEYFNCCTHTTKEALKDDTILLLQYPQDWVCRYFDQDLVWHDPVVTVAMKSMLPFFWRAPHLLPFMKEKQVQVLDAAAGFGLAHGFTVPLHVPGHGLASFSATGPADAMTEENVKLVHMIAPYVYNRAYAIAATHDDAKRMGILDERERQILALVGQGKSDWAIAQIVAMSQRSVSRRIEKIRAGFGVATRTQAVTKALFEGHISFDDVLRARAE